MDAQSLNVQLKVFGYVQSFIPPATATIISPVVITALSPKAAPINGSPFTLQVSGDGSGRFDSGCSILINGVPYPTTLMDPNTLQAAGINPSTLGVPGSLLVTVQDSTPGTVTSNFLLFQLKDSLGPAPVLTSLNPSSIAAGSASFTLTLNGSGFTAGSIVRWAGKTKTPTFVSPTVLTVMIPSYDITKATTPVYVRNLDRQVSATVNFTVSGGTMMMAEADSPLNEKKTANEKKTTVVVVKH
jgi:hypothetical protein